MCGCAQLSLLAFIYMQKHRLRNRIQSCVTPYDLRGRLLKAYLQWGIYRQFWGLFLVKLFSLISGALPPSPRLVVAVLVWIIFIWGGISLDYIGGLAPEPPIFASQRNVREIALRRARRGKAVVEMCSGYSLVYIGGTSPEPPGVGNYKTKYSPRLVL